ncbi:MAG: MBL fold metallo-hydrolase [Deltaproteobacteria bacterium]|nr:MBL fold metallo-hydrolase [Deltaproteobacteria bacterium]
MIRALLALSLLCACPGPAEEAPASDVVESAPTPALAPEPDYDEADVVVLSTEAGDIVVTPVYHGTAIVSFGEVVIWLDPWSKGTLEGRPRADVVLITDIHSDHLDPAALALVSKDGTKVVTPKVVADALERKVEHVLANGEQVVLGEVTIQAIPMYNKVRGPEADVQQGPRPRGGRRVPRKGAGQRLFAHDGRQARLLRR